MPDLPKRNATPATVKVVIYEVSVGPAGLGPQPIDGEAQILGCFRVIGLRSASTVIVFSRMTTNRWIVP